MPARLLAAALAAALLAVPRVASGRDAELDAPPAPTIPAPPAPPSTPPLTEDPPIPPPEEPGPVRPILLVGVGGASGALTLGADLGVRFAPVTARYAWRGEFLSSGDSLVFHSGRLGWIFADRGWISAHAGVGAGRLTRSFDDFTRPSVSSTAVVGEVGALLMPAWALGPVLGVELEALQPVGRTAPGAHLTAPVVSVMVSLNLALVLLMALPGTP